MVIHYRETLPSFQHCSLHSILFYLRTASKHSPTQKPQCLRQLSRQRDIQIPLNTATYVKGMHFSAITCVRMNIVLAHIDAASSNLKPHAFDLLNYCKRVLQALHALRLAAQALFSTAHQRTSDQRNRLSPIVTRALSSGDSKPDFSDAILQQSIHDKPNCPSCNRADEQNKYEQQIKISR